MAPRGGRGGRGGEYGTGRGNGRFGADVGGRGPGGRGGDGGGFPHQNRRGGSHQQAYGGDEGRGGGAFQHPHRPYGVGGGGCNRNRNRNRNRGGGEELAHPNALPAGHQAPGAAPAPPPPPPPLTEASSSSSPAPPPSGAATAASVLAGKMGKLDVLSPAPPAPAASPAASAPAATSEEESPASKRIAHPARPGKGRQGKEIMVRANHFLVEVADNDICHYEVTIVPKPNARRTNRDVLKVFVATYLDGKTPAYDGSKNLYTAGELPIKPKGYVVKLRKEHRESEYTIMIRYVGRANAYAIQALDVVLRESPSLKYFTFSRSFFSKDFRHEYIGQGLECWGGYYQSLRPTQMGFSLNIDISSTAFYKPILVTEFVKDFIQGESPWNKKPDPKQPIDDSYRLMLEKALHGVRVQTTHDKKSVYKITTITSAPLAQLNFSLNDESQVTVVQYFSSRYNYQLKYTAWPCLQSGNGHSTKPIYLPMEVCRIIEEQRYPYKLTQQHESRMVRVTCEGPQRRKNRILRTVGKNNYSADTRAQTFGIKVANEMIEVPARLLPPPELKYYESGRVRTCFPRLGKWDMINKKMVNGGSVQRWNCLNFSNRWTSNVAHELCNKLARMCTSMGMDFHPVTEIIPALPEEIENALWNVNSKAPDLELLIVILPDAPGYYGKVKRLCETEIGIVSQCINPYKFNVKDNQYLKNVALKINVKVGGHNTVLVSDVAKNILFEPETPTIIFGADVTHPAAGEDSVSIAAVVASMDLKCTTYKALISAQTRRQEIIKDLFCTEENAPENGGMIRELLRSFNQRTDKWPLKIIFYRDGVSEGQFSHVLDREIEAIKKACKYIGEGYQPKVTFVVVQKRHHTRLFPDGHENCDRNILPGTVVDTEICHRSEFDFYLCSHAAIKRTSRPIHYHVLYDENNFSADDLQMLTNDLCYTYARCTRSLSVVPPVHYAHLAAARARYYDKRDGTDAASVVSGGGDPPRLPQLKENVKNVMFFC